MGAGGNCIMRSLMICTANNVLLKVKLFCYMSCGDKGSWLGHTGVTV